MYKLIEFPSLDPNDSEHIAKINQIYRSHHELNIDDIPESTIFTMAPVT